MAPIMMASQRAIDRGLTMTIADRLATTAIAGLAGFVAVGIYTMFAGNAQGVWDVVVVMVLFTAVYTPGVFVGRRLLTGYAHRVLENASVFSR